ncbi:MAG: hypothetical protein QOH41_287 [Blastocatellia bacterium]|nr:hypothetical protein [Blastocatellia bacterium]
MKFQSHLLRIVTLSITSLLFVIALAAFSPVSADTPQAESAAERFVREQVEKGEVAVLAKNKPDSERRLSASFVAKLLISRDARLSNPHGVSILGAVITGDLNLRDLDIPNNVFMDDCTFDAVDLHGSHFAKSLGLTHANFKYVDFSDATIGLDFIANLSSFKSNSFDRMRVGRDFRIEGSTFDSAATSFESTTVAGIFTVDDCVFNSIVSFNNMRVDGSFSAKGCVFAEWKEHPNGESRVTFIGGHFADVFLNGSSFNKVSTIDFTGMQADLISLEGVQPKTLSGVKHEQMTFKLLRPMNAEKLQLLFSPFDAELYTTVESLFRTHGYPDEADKIFIARKRAERREQCPSLLQKCHPGAWAWSMFQDALAGYGKSLQNLLYWSLGFLLIGIFVFRREKGMRLKDEKDAPHYAGRYNAFWYSLDLFLPIIKLGEADVWTPKDDRRWANLYRKVHIIIGSLFVPIGLAAWTGIIK